MKIKKIKENNGIQFLEDIREATDVMVYAKCSNLFVKAYKSDVLREAEGTRIHYYMTRQIFKVGRLVMVLI